MSGIEEVVGRAYDAGYSRAAKHASEGHWRGSDRDDDLRALINAVRMEPTEEDVERVARAIRHAATGQPHIGTYPLEKWRDQARAALAAIGGEGSIG